MDDSACRLGARLKERGGVAARGRRVVVRGSPFSRSALFSSGGFALLFCFFSFLFIWILFLVGFEARVVCLYASALQEP
jgi:hypothetical protein